MPASKPPRRLDARKKLLSDMGGEMKHFYMVMGDFDFAGICDAPDDAVIARYVLQLGGLGFVRAKTLKAFSETAYQPREERLFRGGERARAGRIGKDRSQRDSRQSIASGEYASPPEAEAEMCVLMSTLQR